MMRAAWHTAVVVALAAVPFAGLAQDIPGYPALEAYDPREMAMLPGYCKHTIYFRDHVPGGNNAAAIEQWGARLGPAFLHLHHYCFGLMKAHRGVLLARDPQVRQFYLRESLREFDYVLERAPRDFVLLPEILTKKGENLLKLDRAPVAIFEFERAVELKPDYWPAFAQMSDYYRRIGDLDKARETLHRGLKAAPDTPALSRRLKELDEKPRPARKDVTR